MPAGSTYTPIATTTLGSSTNSVTFSSISGSYTDLVLICANLGAASAQSLYAQVNTDTGTNYSRTWITGNGSAASSSRASTNSQGLFVGATDVGLPSTGVANAVMSFQNYSNTTTYKTTLTRYNAAGQEVQAAVSLWRSTSAINSIKVYATSSALILAGATFTLYGIASA
jgi:hypothetical protein